MQEITTLFTAIGDFFTKADWYAMIKWPFWILLFTVAAGGVYCARFGKKTLLNKGITGMLNLMVIYLTATICYIHMPPLRTMFSELPFLSVTEVSVSLLNPFALKLEALAPVLLQLMLLILLVNLFDTLSAGGKTLLTWLFFQFVTIAIALLFYNLITAAMSMILPDCLTRFAIVPVVIVAAIAVLMLCVKFFFTFFSSGGNPYFSAVYKFFTVNKGGILFTTSALSLLLFMVILSTMHMSKIATLAYRNANTSGLWVILLMLLAVLYIFGMFYNDKRKA